MNIKMQVATVSFGSVPVINEINEEEFWFKTLMKKALSSDKTFHSFY